MHSLPPKLPGNRYLHVLSCKYRAICYNNQAQSYLKDAEYYADRNNLDKVATRQRWAKDAVDKAKTRQRWAKDAKDKAKTRLEWARDALKKAYNKN